MSPIIIDWVVLLNCNMIEERKWKVTVIEWQTRFKNFKFVHLITNGNWVLLIEMRFRGLCEFWCSKVLERWERNDLDSIHSSRTRKMNDSLSSFQLFSCIETLITQSKETPWIRQCRKHNVGYNEKAWKRYTDATSNASIAIYQEKYFKLASHAKIAHRKINKTTYKTKNNSHTNCITKTNFSATCEKKTVYTISGLHYRFKSNCHAQSGNECDISVRDAKSFA